MLANALEFVWEKYLNRIRQAVAEHRKIFIYGAGIYGKRLYQELNMRNIPVTGFCVTKLSDVRELYGKPVRSVEDVYNIGGDTCFYLLAAKSPIKDEMATLLRHMGIDSYIDMPEMVECMLDDAFRLPVLEITPKAGCKVHCHFCPQDLFLHQYSHPGQSMEMPFDVFKACLDKTPVELMVDFSGFVEPFLAQDAVHMMQYAVETGHPVRLFTTLVGLDRTKFDAIRQLPFHFVMLHLPDAKGYANIERTDAYYNLLSYIMTCKKADGSYFINEANCQDVPDERAYNLVKDKVSKVTWSLIDRAGNLGDEQLESKKQAQGPLYCQRALDLNHNVLLPNGDVVLCCMDFGMKHVLGNLLYSSYQEVLNGRVMQGIKQDLTKQHGACLCWQCTASGTLPQ